LENPYLRIASWSSISLPRLLLFAAILHASLSIGITVIGKLRVLPQTFDHNGIGVSFALDSVSYRDQAAHMARLLREGKFREWIAYRAPLATFHSRLYSISFALLSWLLGEGVLAAEPINLFFYLSMLVLTYLLGASVFSPAVARLTAAVVALWPSLLMFSTQFMHDPLFIAAFLLLLLGLVATLIDKEMTARGALAYAGSGCAALLLILLARSTMWEIIRATVFLGAAFFVLTQLGRRRFEPIKIMAILVLCVAVVVLPKIMEGDGRRVDVLFERAIATNTTLQTSIQDASPWTKTAIQVGWVRNRFINRYAAAGSNLDVDVKLQTTGDLVKYFPRALEIGLLAPFPSLWFSAGQKVGLSGRLWVGAEMLMFYLVLILACVTLVRERRRLIVWFLFLTTLLACTVLAYVVVNAGALYRIRYPYFIPIILLGVHGFYLFSRKRTPQATLRSRALGETEQ
jgi:hypothetical protein